MPPPSKPGNWKQETFDAKLPELRAKQEEAVLADPPVYVGELVEADWVVVNENDQVVPAPAADPDELPEHIVLRAVVRADREGIPIIGFNAAAAIRTAAWQLGRHGACPPLMWLASETRTDGVRVMDIETLMRTQKLTRAEILAICGVTPTEDGLKDLMALVRQMGIA